MSGDNPFSEYRFTPSTDLNGERNEARLISKHLKNPDRVVLELGGNVGRASVVIGSKLRQSTNHVVVEPGDVSVLNANLKLNHLHSCVVNAAISKTPLTLDGWISKPAADHGNVSITSMEDVHRTCALSKPFDTIVADCEGCLLPVLKDHPSMLDTVDLLIVENDWTSHADMEEFYALTRDHGFTSVECDANQEWGRECFYQVLSKNKT